MDYLDSLRWLLTLPDFERTGEFAARTDVTPMLALLSELGDPHLDRATVHVAGSKGKGSTSVMIESVLKATGLRTGCYVSPHLHRYNERIRIDGTPIAPEAFAAAMARVRDAIERLMPTMPSRTFVAFDALTAAAFVAFRDAAVEAQVIEVGLGGRLDPTNVFHGPAAAADVVVLTPISLEHTAVLGDTVAAIAEEKAGIITRGATVIVAPQRESALDVFRRVAAGLGAHVTEVAGACQVSRTRASLDGQEFKLKTPRATYAATLPLAGRHQLNNAATAVLACEALAERRGFELTPSHVRGGLSAVAWPARIEVVRRRDPMFIVDGAHNADSVRALVATLRDDFGVSQPAYLFGTLAGKDVEAMIGALPLLDYDPALFVTEWQHPRAMPVAEAGPRADAALGGGSAYRSFRALQDALSSMMTERGPIVAFGSIAFAAQVREYLLGIESDMIRLALARDHD